MLALKLSALVLLASTVSGCAGLQRLGGGDYDANKDEVARLPQDCYLVQELKAKGSVKLYGNRVIELPLKSKMIEKINYLCQDDLADLKQRKAQEETVNQQRSWLNPELPAAVLKSAIESKTGQ